MLGALRRGKGAARGLFALALLALALRAILPAGMMPAATGAGLVAIVLCGGGQAEALLDLRTGELHEEAPADRRADEGAPCLFAAAAEASAPPILRLAAHAPDALILRDAPAPPGATAAFLAARPWPTGPPEMV